MPHAWPAPAVSVLMPVYNGERFLVEAIESILGQTFADFEFVIVDDGSTDSSPAILADYASRDLRIRVLSQANTGIVAALNRGLAECRAPLVARMDADDISLPTRLERQVAFLAVHPHVAVVGTAFQLVSETGSAGPVVRHARAHHAIRRGLRHGNCLGHPTVMMRREAIVAVGGYREFLRHAEDYDLWARVAERYELANISDCLLLYRVHGGQVSSAVAEAQVLATLAVQGLARARLRSGREPPPRSDMPDHEFLALLGCSKSRIQFATAAAVANRVIMCDSLGMVTAAAAAREQLLDLVRGEEDPRARNVTKGLLSWTEFAAAWRTRNPWAVAKSLGRCIAFGLFDTTLMKIALRRWMGFPTDTLP